MMDLTDINVLLWLLIAILSYWLALHIGHRWDMRRKRVVANAMKGKVVWITGASSGIGRSLALRFAECGSKLVISARDHDRLVPVRETCLSAPHAALDWEAWQAVEATENDDSILSLLGFTARPNYTFVVPPSESQTSSFIASAFSSTMNGNGSSHHDWSSPSSFSSTRAPSSHETKSGPVTDAVSGGDEKRSVGLSSTPTPTIGVHERKVAPTPAQPTTPGRQMTMTYSPTLVPLDLALIANTPHLAKLAVQQVIDVHGRIDILINNAGVSMRGCAADTQHVVDRHVMDTNYLGTIALTKAVLPIMMAQKSGTICTVSSVQGVLAVPERTAYAASKHAIQGFFKSLALEVADHNIDITLALPGYVATSLSKNALTSDGGLYGRTDDTTANGMTPAAVSYAIVNAIASRTKHIIIADMATRAAVYVDRWFPSLMFHVMRYRDKRKKRKAAEAAALAMQHTLHNGNGNGVPAGETKQTSQPPSLSSHWTSIASYDPWKQQ